MISQVTYIQITQELNSLPFASGLQSADGKRESHHPQPRFPSSCVDRRRGRRSLPQSSSLRWVAFGSNRDSDHDDNAAQA